MHHETAHRGHGGVGGTSRGLVGGEGMREGRGGVERGAAWQGEDEGGVGGKVSQLSTWSSLGMTTKESHLKTRCPCATYSNSRIPDA